MKNFDPGLWGPLKPFIVVTFAFSWTVFFVFDGWLIPHFTDLRKFDMVGYLSLFGHALAMFGPMIGAMVCWKVLRFGAEPKWVWGKRSHYLIAFGLFLIYWIVPGILYALLGKGYDFRWPVGNPQKMIILSGLTLYWLFGLGEETGWCGFLIPFLTQRTSTNSALIISGVLRGLWHLPVLVAPLIYQVFAHQIPVSRLAVMTLVFAVQLACSNIAFGSIFFWIWRKTNSLPLVGWMHQWYDAFRDISLIFIVNYFNSQWFKLYSGFAMAAIACYAILSIYKMNVEKNPE
jgi:membrane protease YdiL (CAAX protease family)